MNNPNRVASAARTLRIFLTVLSLCVMIATVAKLAELNSSLDRLRDYRLARPQEGKSMYLDGRLETNPVYVHPDTKVEYK